MKRQSKSSQVASAKKTEKRSERSVGTISSINQPLGDTFPVHRHIYHILHLSSQRKRLGCMLVNGERVRSAKREPRETLEEFSEGRKKHKNTGQITNALWLIAAQTTAYMSVIDSKPKLTGILPYWIFVVLDVCPGKFELSSHLHHASASVQKTVCEEMKFNELAGSRSTSDG
ncbi:hypothetical protein GQR58_026182 [Nymphon striatum]|nr:hypothetical protein GQR58_026182 [Nymphon striatum]